MSLYVEQHGPDDAPAIVFLHGLGVSSWMWTDQVRELSTDHRCITVDLPGNGRSAHMPWVSLDAAADAVVTAITSIGATPAHLVGLSLGGYVVLRLLARHPDAVASVVVSGITQRPLTPRWLWRALTRAGAPLLCSGAVARLSARALHLPSESRPLFVRDARTLTAATVRRIYAEVIDFRPPAALHDRVHRVLAVAGSREATAVRDSLADILEAVPRATAAIAPGGAPRVAR